MSILYNVFYSFGVLFFFFKQKTAYEMRISDWSSDVCSSDLAFHQRIQNHRTQMVGTYRCQATAKAPDRGTHGINDNDRVAGHNVHSPTLRPESAIFLPSSS